MLTYLRGEQQNATKSSSFSSQRTLIDSKRLKQRPPEASRPQVRDNDSKCTVKFLLENAFQKGRNQNKWREYIQVVVRRQRMCKNFNPAGTRSCTRCKVGKHWPVPSR